MKISTILLEYLAPLLAVLSGILSYKHFTFFWKLLFLQVLLYVIAIKLVYEITPVFHTNSNHWFYNGYLIIEIGLLCFAPLQLFKTTFEKLSLLLLFAFYVLVFAFQIYLNGLDQFANFAFASAGFVVSLIYGYILYLSFQIPEWAHPRSAIIWASFGLILFFACNVPYFSLFNYLNTHFLTLSRFMFHVITDVLANARYFMLALAFYLVRKHAISKSQTL